MKNISFLKFLDYPFSPEKWFRKEYKTLSFEGIKSEMPFHISKKANQLIKNFSEIPENQIINMRLLY